MVAIRTTRRAFHHPYLGANVPTHKQVLFITLDRRSVEVDAGMLYILQELRRLGAKTQYSCQGDVAGAYVLMDRWSFNRLRRRIVRCRVFGGYSEDSLDLLREFRSGYRTQDFRTWRTNEAGVVLTRRVLFARGVNDLGQFTIEQDYSRRFGIRTTLRWPTAESDRVLQLLKETK